MAQSASFGGNVPLARSQAERRISAERPIYRVGETLGVFKGWFNVGCPLV